LICTMSMTAVVGVLLFHLTLLTKGYSYAQVQFLLGLLFLVIDLLILYIWWYKKVLRMYSIVSRHDTRNVTSYLLNVQAFLLLLVCPFNIIYRSSRYHFLCVIRNIIWSPLYKVHFSFSHYIIMSLVIKSSPKSCTVLVIISLNFLFLSRFWCWTFLWL